MANIKNVASYLVSLSQPSSPRAITPSKLQKLVYFAQGVYLSKHSQPLFTEEMKACNQGPVSFELYDKYKEYRYSTIPNNPFNIRNKISELELESINEAWEVYSHYDGKFIEELVHQVDPLLHTEINQVVDNRLIEKHFISKRF